MEYDIKPPYLYDNKWYIFSDTVLSELENSGCESTVYGYCPDVSSLEDCVKICENNECMFGWYIEKNGKKICGPLVTHPEKEIRPYHRMRNKNAYSDLENIKAYTFTNKEMAPFPPNKPNQIYYMDHFVIKNINSGMMIALDKEQTLNPEVVFSENNPVYVQLLSGSVIRDKLESSITVKNGDDVIINIPKSSMILRKRNNDNHISWVLRANSNNSSSDTFKIFGLNKKLGETLNYQDEIYFVYQTFPLIFEEGEKALHVSNESVENALYDKLNII